jgi:esterase/lipase superfamily enzyme
MKKSTPTTLAVLALCACAEQPPPPAPPAPPPPPAFAPPPPSAVVPAYTTVPVFFATDRQKTGSGSYETLYGAGLNTQDLQYGEAIVTIPAAHIMGQIERPPTFFSIQFREENPEKDIVIFSLGNLDRNAFLRDLSQTTEAGTKDIFIFVHGFNTSFAEGMRQTAQLKYDLPFNGPAVLYSWPSDGKTAAFTADVNLSLTTIQHLEELLQQVAAASTTNRIHILAHSLGSRPLLYALYDLRNNAQVHNKIKNVILAAPEIPQVTYLQMTNAMKSSQSYNITLYASSRDQVLRLAESADQLPSREFIPRLGDLRKGIFLNESLQTIDASTVDTDFLGHHYFADTIVPDMQVLMDKGTPPGQRGLVARVTPIGTYWVIPAPGS